MAKRKRRLLINRGDYFRSLLPAAKDEEAKRIILEVIQEEEGRPRDSCVLDEKVDKETS